MIRGSGLLNKLINSLPFELHIPTYHFCGPGTKLKERLARGDKGKNQLDEACRQHDISYEKYKDIENRHEADKILLKEAVKRYKSKNASIQEKLAALTVAGGMKVKTKFGMGLKKRKKSGGKKRVSRILPLAKRGGVLPLLPALAALGTLASGVNAAAGIARTINTISNNKKQLNELKKHNAFIEGRGLYLKPYKKGGGSLKQKIKKKKRKNCSSRTNRSG